MPQPARLRPRRAPGRARLGKGMGGRGAQHEQPTRTDTGEFQPGAAQPGPDGPHEAASGRGAPGRRRVTVPVAPYAERGGRVTAGMSGEGFERAGTTWDWFVNTTCWDWYENSSGRNDRGDADA
ncbi:hypothetical protein D7D52_08910 [Nocardia yunnanensis]|uniref:Uncharacterized protein n=1 Tax=Nocardia yunnanensis TaxID=2382165 RepID=A0A386ZA27_9NOCA|nr:hypothetical protein [Nocardia yunnanensis]AYF73964.1 hypothetical protein D7D52_08910 [Nocardia yunnanensis]